MSEPYQRPAWVALFQYPVTTLSMLLALLVAKSLLGMRLGQEARTEIADIDCECGV